jgi:hypothetical protein
VSEIKKVGKRNESNLERNYEFGTVGVDVVVTEMQIMLSRAVLISLCGSHRLAARHIL